MPARTELNQGFVVHTPAWHGMFPVFDEYPGREKAFASSGQNWLVEERQPASLIDRGSEYEVLPIEGWKNLHRSDDGSFLAPVRDSYTVVQNSVLWDIAEALLDSKDLQYETAGVLDHGLEQWVLIRMKVPFVVPGDNSETYMYLLVRNRHDGTMALVAVLTCVRVVCGNTLSMALNGKGRQFSFRHTGDVMSRITQAKDALLLAGQRRAEFEEFALELASRPITDAKVATFIETMVPMPITAGITTDRVVHNITKARKELFTILNASETIPEEHRRTAYGLWCAGVEYLDHFRTARTKETLFRRTVDVNDSLKSSLRSLVLDVSKS